MLLLSYAICYQPTHSFSFYRIVTDIINSLQGFIVFVIFISSRKKRAIVTQSWEGTMSTVSQAARKLSRTDETGVVWRVNDDQVCVSRPDGSSSDNRKLTEEMTPDLDEGKEQQKDDMNAAKKGELNAGFRITD